MMHEQAHENHVWLAQMVGEWRTELAGLDAAGQPQHVSTGRETVRRLGELWIVTDGVGDKPDQPMPNYVVTLGYDTRSGRFRGAFLGSDMSYFWAYEGELDAARKVLSLQADGPSFTPPHDIVRYVDTIELLGPDERILRSCFTNADDQRQPPFMQIHSWRVG